MFILQDKLEEREYEISKLKEMLTQRELLPETEVNGEDKQSDGLNFAESED